MELTCDEKSALLVLKGVREGRLTHLRRYDSLPQATNTMIIAEGFHIVFAKTAEVVIEAQPHAGDCGTFESGT